MNDHLSKPINPLELARALLRWIPAHRRGASCSRWRAGIPPSIPPALLEEARRTPLSGGDGKEEKRR